MPSCLMVQRHFMIVQAMHACFGRPDAAPRRAGTTSGAPIGVVAASSAAAAAAASAAAALGGGTTGPSIGVVAVAAAAPAAALAVSTTGPSIGVALVAVAAAAPAALLWGSPAGPTAADGEPRSVSWTVRLSWMHGNAHEDMDRKAKT